VLQVVGQFEVHSLDPATAGGTFTRLQVAETLVDADVDGALQPGLAQDWEASADQRSRTRCRSS
jgi:peptide/nickel transport system substrate-binding protein